MPRFLKKFALPGYWLGCCAALCLAGKAHADPLPPPGAILDKMRLVNSWFMKQTPNPGADIVTNQRRPSNIWTRGVYYEGLLALSALDNDPRYLHYAVAWGDSHRWGLRHGPQTRSADDQCCGQVYLELYQLDPKPERIRAIQASLEAMANSKRADDWTWIDALQMAMPGFARMAAISGDPKYALKMHELFLVARDGSSDRPALFNPKDGLWWRDATFVPPFHEPNGADCYWSRGNGWVMAALVRSLDVLPATSAGRDDYAKMLGQMARAVAAVQRSDGFWNVSLHDPKNFGGKEVSGTALFTYALAAGIRLGILPEGQYRPAVERAWNAMSAEAVHPDGFLGYVQGTGKQPSEGQPVTYSSVPDFKDFGVGCFLLAGSEVYRLAGGRPAPAVRP